MVSDRRVPRGTARSRLLDAAVSVIRRQGLAGTSVDDLCNAAGVTKGAFFHHFESKEALAVAAAGHWTAMTGALFEQAPYHAPSDPRDRVLAYLDYRAAMVEGPAPEYTCLVGTMVQEAFATQPLVRDACAASIFGHAATLEADLAAALDAAGNPPEVTADSLARLTQVVLQGSFVLAKAADDPGIVTESIAHLRRYVGQLLAPAAVAS
jgi:TetR/AcrR family transcriptional regulator, transcriptional repressor for nem operon